MTRTIASSASSPRDVPPVLLATLILGAVLNPINSSLIATALTPIGRSVQVGSAQTAWLVASLYLVAAVAQPLMGRLADLTSPRRVFLVGLGLAGVGGLIGGLGPSLPWLIAARMLIGIGTSAGYPSAMAVLRRVAEQRGRPTSRPVLASISVAAQVLAVIGPTLGGVLVGGLGWRTVFLVNVPVTALGLWLGLRHLPRLERPERGGRVLARLDVPGILLFTVGLSAVLLFLMQLHSAPLYGWLLLGVAALAALAVVERHAAAPFIDLRALGSNRPLLLTYGRALLTALITYSVFYGLPQWLQESRGFTPAQTGLILLPTSAVSVLITLAVARLPRLSVRVMLLSGSGLLCLCMALYVLLPHLPALGVLVGASLLLGLPWGLNNLGNQQMLTAQSPSGGAGSAAGLFRTAGYLGSILSSSAISCTFEPTATTAGFQSLTWVLLVASVLMLGMTVVGRRGVPGAA